ncbi:MAG: CBS domain-containing protein [Bdellovibrionales bacterium]|nr:CBS domain-containing protein [Bdellovibrionales bacterium]
MKTDSKAPPVKKFMSQVLFTLDENTPLTEAAQFFASHRLTTVPVTSDNGMIVGVLSDFHLLRALLKARQETGHPLLLKDVKEELDPVVTIHEEDSIVSAFRLMVQSPNHRIYALHGERLCGALSPKDVLLYMAGIKDRNDEIMDAMVQKQIETILKELNDTRRQLSEYQQMFHDAPYLMHSVDLNGKITAANKMIHYVLGYEDGSLIGKSLRQLYPPENYKEAMQGLETVAKLGFHPVVNATMTKSDGSLVRVDIASTLKSDDKGTPIGTITVGKLSDTYRMINYLQRAAQTTGTRKTPRSTKKTAV